VGSKYNETKNLSTTEIAKLIRADIKAAKADGSIPKFCKVSVNTEYFANGSSIDVRLKTWEGEMVNIELAREIYPNRPCNMKDILVMKLAKTLSTLQAIHDSYNQDSSESMVDYFCVNYYGYADLDSELSDKIHETLKANNIKGYYDR